MTLPAEEIRAELDRVLASEQFAGAERLSRFLRYAVTRTLAGEADGLKEYAIGHDVYERDASYDPRLDSIVRVEAGRLRARLDEYFTGPGRNDPWRIQIPKGSYAATFARRSMAPDAAQVVPPPAARKTFVPRRQLFALAVLVLLALSGVGLWRALRSSLAAPAPAHSIAVLPFRSYSGIAADERLAAELTDGVTSELARLGTVSVVSHTSARAAAPQAPLRDIARSLGTDLIMEGRVEVAGDDVRVSARLVDATRDRKFWADDFRGATRDLASLHRRIAAAAGAVIDRR